MVVRIVKMTFHPDRVTDFREIFNHSSEYIRAFEGCTHLHLMNDIHHPNVFFTYSIWESEDDLENYRNSGLFRTTWGKTKRLFAERPEAWSVKIEPDS